MGGVLFGAPAQLEAVTPAPAEGQLTAQLPLPAGGEGHGAGRHHPAAAVIGLDPELSPRARGVDRHAVWDEGAQGGGGELEGELTLSGVGGAGGVSCGGAGEEGEERGGEERAPCGAAEGGAQGGAQGARAPHRAGTWAGPSLRSAVKTAGSPSRGQATPSQRPAGSAMGEGGLWSAGVETR